MIYQQWNGWITQANVYVTEVIDAAAQHQWEQLLRLIERNSQLVNIARPDEGTWNTPLHYAAQGGASLAVVQRLIELDAWRTIRNAGGERPLDVAVKYGHRDLYTVLEPVYEINVPASTVEQIEKHLHVLLQSFVQKLIAQYGLRLPQLEPILERNSTMSFTVPKLYGSFDFHFTSTGEKAVLNVKLESRVWENLNSEYEITVEGSTRLEDQV